MWQDIMSVPVDTWVLVRKTDSPHNTVPSVAMFSTQYRQWIPSDVISSPWELFDADVEAVLVDFYAEWSPTEWHPIPE